MEPKRIHFLHISKNAGTQMGNLAQQINAEGRYRVEKHSHSVKLRNIPEKEYFFFSIRSPERLVVSGFYSRKRKCQPRIYREWSSFEPVARQSVQGPAGRIVLKTANCLRLMVPAKGLDDKSVYFPIYF